MEVVYEDNHLIIVNKACGEIVQGDRTGDEPLVETLKQWIKIKYNKPGNVFCGVTHRIDRPTCGLVVFARTSKGLSRMNDLFRRGEVHKTYWAIVKNRPPKMTGKLVDYLLSVEKNNKTYISKPGTAGAQRAELNYRVIAQSDNYYLLEIELITGRKHQIRAQLAHMGCPIKGDLKYGAQRSNPNGGISLQSHNIHFIHPVSHQEINVTAPVPNDSLWQALAATAE
ncbi:MAG: RluA family pseudouridine synthase [Bacteroidales bacterium]|nr:RluA family pseudouridine synthase [Bacteroidales bacterium]